MSKLDELIQELCPDGVEFALSGDLAEIGTGKSDRKNATDIGEYPFYVRSKEILSIDSYEFDETAIVIPGEGGIGDIFHLATGKYALHQRAYRVHFTDSRINPAFAFYYFQEHFKRFILSKAVSATVTSIRKPMLTEFPIPIPPLEVQEEIVRILDQFVELDRELEEEIAGREKQLRMSREALFSQITGETALLGDIAEVRSGWGFPKKYQGEKAGDFPFFKVGDMNHEENRVWMTRADNYVSNDVADELKTNPAPEGTVIFPKVGAAVATNKKRKLSASAAYDNNVMGLIASSALNPNYLFQWALLQNLVDWSNHSGAVPSIRKTVVEGQKIPLPPLEVQEEIAAELDAFTEYIDNVKRERELRQKQYEYYRDQLLDFKVKE